MGSKMWGGARGCGAELGVQLPPLTSPRGLEVLDPYCQALRQPGEDAAPTARGSAPSLEGAKPLGSGLPGGSLNPGSPRGTREQSWLRPPADPSLPLHDSPSSTLPPSPLPRPLLGPPPRPPFCIPRVVAAAGATCVGARRACREARPRLARPSFPSGGGADGSGPSVVCPAGSPSAGAGSMSSSWERGVAAPPGVLPAPCASKVELRLSCRHLLDRDPLTKSDPSVVLLLQSQGQWVQVGGRRGPPD